ncbi:MAG: 23S rRNA (adenine(2503)-C(2))-methyltransferase RlmN [Alphaproteobacteria bacterium]
MTQQKQNLIGLNKEELFAIVSEYGMKPFRAKQLWQWIYFYGAQNFDAMTNLSKADRALLSEHFMLLRPEIEVAQKSTDGTRKWLLKFADGKTVETVHIPEEDRGTLCLSSQVGCTLSCKFCHTGTQKLLRNLTTEEILGQFMVSKDHLSEWGTKSIRDITNIVMMGMGEPLFNFDNVAKALKIIMDPDGIAFSKRRITLSTSGVVPFIERCGSELGVNLAVSLHATTDEVRSKIMPINRKYPIAELMHACDNYPTLNNARRITFEYILIKDLNDTDEDARRLVKLLRGIPSKVNLIPFNPWEGAPFETSTPERVQRFSKIIYQSGISAPIRTPRGQDIDAACGQLKSKREENSS